MVQRRGDRHERRFIDQRLSILIILLAVLFVFMVRQPQISLAPIDATNVSECQELAISGYYIFNGSIAATDTCIIISGNDIILDGDGYTLTGPGASAGRGIVFNNTDNATLKNLSVSSFQVGVHVENGSSINVENIDITDASIGILTATNTSSVAVTNNTISQSSIGIAAYSQDSTYSNNTIVNMGSSGVTINGINNTFKQTSVTTAGSGVVLNGATNTRLSNTIVSGIATNGIVILSSNDTTIINTNTDTVALTSFGTDAFSKNILFDGGSISAGSNFGFSIGAQNTTIQNIDITTDGTENAIEYFAGADDAVVKNVSVTGSTPPTSYDLRTGTSINLTLQDSVLTSYALNNANLTLQSNEGAEIAYINPISVITSNPSEVALSYNYVFAQTGSTFDQPAIITFTGLPAGLQNVMILRDGVPCGSICTPLTPLDGETVSFEVTGFSNYTINGTAPGPVPNVSIISPPEGAVYGSESSSVPFNVLVEGATTVEYTLDEGMNNVSMGVSIGAIYIAVNDSIADGTYTFRVYAYNSFGVNNSETTTFTVDSAVIGTSDIDVPLISINSPVEGATYGDDLLPTAFEIVTNEIATVFYSLDGSANISMNTNDNLSFTSPNPGLSEGLHVLEITAIDDAGNLNSTNVSFTIDSTLPPTVTINSPTDQTYDEDEVPFDVEIVLNEIGSTARYSLDNWETNTTLSTTDNITFTHNNLDLSDGSYRMRFFVNDTDGNVNNGVTVDFDVDTTSSDDDDDSGGGGGGGGGSSLCGQSVAWSCTTWSTCSSSGTQSRTCTKIDTSCSDPLPIISRTCTPTSGSTTTPTTTTTTQTESTDQTSTGTTSVLTTITFTLLLLVLSVAIVIIILLILRAVRHNLGVKKDKAPKYTPPKSVGEDVGTGSKNRGGGVIYRKTTR